MTTNTPGALLSHLWRGGQWAHYWTPDGPEKTSAKGEKYIAKISRWFPVDKIPPIPATWARKNVYFSVHPCREIPPTNSKGKKVGRESIRVQNGFVAVVNGFFAEFDAKHFEGGKAAILAHLDTFPQDRGWPFPSVIVDSGGGYHCYFLLEDAVTVTDENRDTLRAIQATWVTLVGGDADAKDFARVLRVPDTLNVKPEYGPNFPTVTVIEENYNRLYSLTDFERLTEHLRRTPEPPPAKTTPTPAQPVHHNGHIEPDAADTELTDDIPTPTQLFDLALRRPQPEGRNQTGFWLACQLRDCGYTQSEAKRTMDNYQATVGNTGTHPYTEQEAAQSLASAYAQTKREAWVLNGNGNGYIPDEPPPGVGVQDILQSWSVAEEPPWANAADTAPTVHYSDPHTAAHSPTDPPERTPVNAAPVTFAEDDDEAEIHPLDVETPPLALGWIDEYADLMTKLTGSPREFNVVCGLVTAATAIQRKARLRMSFADIYPNIYAAIIARSSVYHKSVALHKPRALLQRAMLERLTLSELMTSEGLLAQLQNQPSGMVIRDEIGTLFDSHRVKYLRTLKPDLTALYDCLPYSRRLSNVEIKVAAPYLNILGATTPARFYDAITATDWQDGFMARWLFVLPEGEPDFDAVAGLYEAQHDAEIGRLAVTLQNLDRQREQDFALAGDAFSLWDGWQRQKTKDAYYFGDDSIAAVVTRYSTYALKFALVLAAVNGEWGRVTLPTMQTAIHLADSFKRSVARLLREKNEHLVSGAQLQKVFKAIKILNGDGKGVTTKTILQRTGMRKAQLTPCLEKLSEIGAITYQNAGNGFRYWAMADELPIRTWN